MNAVEYMFFYCLHAFYFSFIVSLNNYSLSLFQMANPYQVFIIPLTVYTGMEQVFLMVEYTRVSIPYLLPTGSEEKEVLGVWSIPVAICPSCHYMKHITLYLHRYEIFR